MESCLGYTIEESAICFLNLIVLLAIYIKCKRHLTRLAEQRPLKLVSKDRNQAKWWGHNWDHFTPSNNSQMVYIVPIYPHNYNPLLPLTLLQQIDQLNPREYLTYVMSLTLEERECLMSDERQRRRTFLVNWPYDDQRSGIQMAQAGFYSVDEGDRVQCVFCRGSLNNWDTGETPMTEHSKSFYAFCRFVRGLECGNREYRLSTLSADDTRNITTSSHLNNLNQNEPLESQLLGISMNRAVTAEYAPEATRMQTFNNANWPQSCPITPQRLCAAGFFFAGYNDQVFCFYCDGGLSRLDSDTSPWEDHARLYPDCPFLIEQKGHPYIDEVLANTPDHKKCKRKSTNLLPVPPRNEEAVQQRRYPTGCLICERNSNSFVAATHIGLPCGHLLFCLACKRDYLGGGHQNPTQCPIDVCRGILNGTIRVYFG